MLVSIFEFTSNKKAHQLVGLGEMLRCSSHRNKAIFVTNSYQLLNNQSIEVLAIELGFKSKTLVTEDQIRAKDMIFALIVSIHI